MDYSKYVKTPGGNDSKKITEYQKALDGKKSSAFDVSAPLGTQYFYNTGMKCGNKKKEKQYVFIDARPSVKSDNVSLANCVADCDILDPDCIKCLPKNSIYYSALNDLTNNISNTLAQTGKNDCVKMTRDTIDVKGKKKKETRYGKESFVTLPSLQDMDAGQQFFIGSISVVGLFLFFKAFYKR